MARIAVPLAFGLYSLWRGADVNWDLYNYHLYNPYAWLHGRMQFDLAPAGLQTYFNPLLDLPLYWANTHLPAPLVGFAMGVLHGVVFVLVLAIAQRLVSGLPGEDRDRAALLLAAAGCMTPAFLGEVGTSMGDDTTALLSLSALLLVVSDWRRLGESPTRSALIAMASGGLIGLGTGLKLTNAMYAVALCGALLSYPDRLLVRLRLSLSAGVGVLAGLATTGGYWLVHLWLTFGNPLYPQYGTIFPNPLTRPIAQADLRWFPKGSLEAALWPFIFSANPHRVSEVGLRQVIWPILYVLFFAWVVRRGAALWAHRNDADLEPRARFVGLYVGLSYLAWLKMFSIHRYLAAIEVLTPIVVFVLLLGLLKYRDARRAAAWLIGLASLVVLTAPARNWGHERWADPLYHAEIPPIENPAQTIAIIVSPDTPWAWLATLFPPDVAFTQLGGNFPASDLYVARVHELVRARGGHAFAIVKGASQVATASLVQAARVLESDGFAIDPAGCASFQAGVGRGVRVYQWCPVRER